MDNNQHFSDADRQGLYRAIHERRDVRSQFLPDPIPDEVLARLLKAAHHAPSVGFMQPWDFIVIDSLEVKQTIKDLYLRENEKAANNYEGEQAEHYRSLKLEGIMDSPINLCITCDRSRGGPNVLGAILFWKWIYSVPVWRCKTYGWPLVLKALVWAG